jgi:hypothetical protein
METLMETGFSTVDEHTKTALERFGRYSHTAMKNWNGFVCVAEWSDVSDSQACNQWLCGVWVRSQLAALDMLHRIKGIFGAGLVHKK